MIVKQENIGNVNKLNLIIASLIFASGIVRSEEDTSIGNLIDAVRPVMSQVVILNHIKADQSFLLAYNNEYVFVSPIEGGGFVYLSSRVGHFSGQFSAEIGQKIRRLIREIKSVKLTGGDKKIISSVVDGMSFLVSNNGILLYSTDPIVLFLSVNGQYSSELSKLTSLQLELLYHLSRFDSVTDSYLELSLDKYRTRMSYEEYLEVLKAEKNERRDSDHLPE